MPKNEENQTEKPLTPNTDEAAASKENDSKISDIPSEEKEAEKPQSKEDPPVQQTIKQGNTPKKLIKPTPNIPEPEAAIDSVECQYRLLEHIQKEQNTIISRMQTIEAEIIGKHTFSWND